MDRINNILTLFYWMFGEDLILGQGTTGEQLRIFISPLFSDRELAISRRCMALHVARWCMVL